VGTLSSASEVLS